MLALRLGDVDRTPHQPVTRTNVTDLAKVLIPLLIENHENLKVELRDTKKTLARVTEERDEARQIIIHLREHNKTLSHILSENIKFKEMTIQRNEGTVQKRMRLSDR